MIFTVSFKQRNHFTNTFNCTSWQQSANRRITNSCQYIRVNMTSGLS